MKLEKITLTILSVTLVFLSNAHALVAGTQNQFLKMWKTETIPNDFKSSLQADLVKSNEAATQKLDQQNTKVAQLIDPKNDSPFGNDMESRRDVLLHYIAVKLAEVGDYDQALEVTQKMELKWQDLALGEIAVKLAEAGQYEKAQQIVDHNEVYPDYKNIRQIGIALIENGEYEQAIKTIEILGMSRSVLLPELVKAGQVEKALDIARNLEPDSTKDSALSEIAIELAKLGKFEQAIELTQNIEIYTDSALSEIAIQLAKVGQFEKAIEIAQTLSRQSDLYRPFPAIAIELVKVGQVERAIKLAQTLQNQFLKDEVLSGIAIQLTVEKQYDRALQLTEVLNDKNVALSVISLAFADAGNYEKALELAHSIEAQSNSNPLSSILREVFQNLPTNHSGSDELPAIFEGFFGTSIKDSTLQGIVTAMVKAGQTELALQTAQTFKTQSSQASALTAISMKLIEIGQYDLAEKVFNQILEKTRSIEVVSDRLSIISNMGWLIAKSEENKNPEFLGLNLSFTVGENFQKNEDEIESLFIRKKAIQLAKKQQYNQA